IDQLSRPDQFALDQAGKGTLDGGNGAGPHVDEIAAPYLQLVMTRLWETEMGDDSRTLHLATLTQLGGAQTIVRTHVDRALSGMPANDRDAAVDIFHHLITRSGTKIALAASDLTEFTDHSEEEIQSLLARLTSSDVRI